MAPLCKATAVSPKAMGNENSRCPSSTKRNMRKTADQLFLLVVCELVFVKGIKLSHLQCQFEIIAIRTADICSPQPSPSRARTHCVPDPATSEGASRLRLNLRLKLGYFNLRFVSTRLFVCVDIDELEKGSNVVKTRFPCHA